MSREEHQSGFGGFEVKIKQGKFDRTRSDKKSYIVVNDGELHQPIILTTAALSLTSQFFAKMKKKKVQLMVLHS